MYIFALFLILVGNLLKIGKDYIVTEVLNMCEYKVINENVLIRKKWYGIPETKIHMEVCVKELLTMIEKNDSVFGEMQLFILLIHSISFSANIWV